jgi:hypothetical protein
MDRVLRDPLPQAEFDGIAIPSAPPPTAWPSVRLATKGFASQFYVHPDSRLTPLSGDFPCVYLGENKATAIAEKWGDRFYGSRKLGVFTIPRMLAATGEFLTTPLPALTVCDWTDPQVRLAIGIEGGTQNATDIALPRLWAERVARHPAKYDGILYRSRHTDQLCVVLWLRPGGRALESELHFTSCGEFRDAPEAYAVAARCGLRLAFV